MGIFVLGLGLLGVVALIALTIVAALVLNRSIGASTPDEASRLALRRIATIYTIAALFGITFVVTVVMLLPVLLPAIMVATETPGVPIAVGPSLAGLLFVGIAAIGEAFWPKPRGEQRGAFLTRRPALANAASIPKWAAVTWGALLLGFLTFFGAIATREGESAGRSIAHPVWNPSVGGASGPFPGWPYGVPMLIFAAALGVAALLVMHVIARRPAVVGATPDDDAALRRVSATNLVKGVQLSLAASLTGALLIGGVAATSGGVLASDGYYATLAGHWWSMPVIALAFVVMICSIGVLFWKTK